MGLVQCKNGWLCVETGQSLELQQELLELETENERLLLNILPRHVVPFFTASRRHGQVGCFSPLLIQLIIRKHI